MDRFTADEFSAHINWRQPGRGSYPRVEVPGWYITAGYANEGVADYFYEDEPMTPEQFQRIMLYISQTLGGPRATQLAASAGVIADESTRRMKAEVERLQTSISAAEERLRALHERLDGKECQK